MTKITKTSSGQFCWTELATQDWQGAKQFYTELFGWGADDQPIGEDMYYTMLQLDGLDVGAMYQMDDERLKNKMPSHWLNYVAVESVDATVEKAKELGAELVAGPHDVGDAGRMAIFHEPDGALFAIWQAGVHCGVKVRDEAGSMCWQELASKNAQKSRDFYGELFGWQFEIEDMDGMAYTLFSKDGKQVAGMLEMTAEWGDMPAHWMTYFEVTNCDNMLERVEELGGKVCVPATDIKNVGRFSVITDPQGGFFSIIQSEK